MKDVARNVYPDDFDAAVLHGLSLMAAGMPRSILATMARGFAAKGRPDAAAGYDHVLLSSLKPQITLESRDGSSA